MKHFSKLYELAASRKGGEAALEKQIAKPKSAAALAKIPDDRWLSGTAKAVFRAGFNWKFVEHKWEGTEAAFNAFDPHAVASMSDDDLDVLVKDERIIRHWKKLKAIRVNAQYVVDDGGRSLTRVSRILAFTVG